MAYIDQIIQNLQDSQDEANAANKTRFDNAMSIYDSILKQFEVGGDFQQGIEAQIAQASKKSVAQSSQALSSSGLYNTSTRAGLGKKFERDVGSTFRLKAEDIRTEGLAKARSAKAGLIERAEDVGPDATSIASLAAQAASK